MRPVNLLPAEDRAPAKGAEPVDRPLGAYGVLAALALAIVAVALVVNARNGIADRQAQLASLTAEATGTEAAAQALQRYGDFRQVAANRVQTVGELARGRFDWGRSMSDLSRALPSTAHLSRVTASTTADSAGDNPLRSGVSAPAIELSGCIARQADVPDMLTRLRTVQGVTRVALASSGRSDSGATVATAPDGFTPSKLCRADTAPTFQVAVFFERAKVPQATAPAGTTPQAGATATPTPSPSPSPSATP